MKDHKARPDLSPSLNVLDDKINAFVPPPLPQPETPHIFSANKHLPPQSDGDSIKDTDKRELDSPISSKFEPDSQNQHEYPYSSIKGTPFNFDKIHVDQIHESKTEAQKGPILNHSSDCVEAQKVHNDGNSPKGIRTGANNILALPITMHDDDTSSDGDVTNRLV